MIAFVTSVVPWASDAHGPVCGSSAAMPFSTPAAGAAGVVGTLHDHVAPEGSHATRSVNVPPTSIPMRTPLRCSIVMTATAYPTRCILKSSRRLLRHRRDEVDFQPCSGNEQPRRPHRGAWWRRREELLPDLVELVEVPQVDHEHLRLDDVVEGGAGCLEGPVVVLH